MQKKKIPMRQCTGCRTMKPKRELVRIVKSPEDEISLDYSGKKPGRGAYICKDSGCLALAKKSRALERAFSAPISDEIYAELKRKMEETDERQ